MKRFSLLFVSCLLLASAVWVGHGHLAAAGSGCTCTVEGQGWAASGVCVPHGGGEMGPCYAEEPCVVTYNSGNCKFTYNDFGECGCATDAIEVAQHISSCGGPSQCYCRVYEKPGGDWIIVEVAVCI